MLTIFDLLSPIIFIFVGGIALIFPNQTIGSNGYSTAYARKSQQVWNYAQKVAPIICIKAGFLQATAAIITRMLPLPVSDETLQTIITSYTLITTITVGFIIEINLRRHFDQNGNPK